MRLSIEKYRFDYIRWRNRLKKLEITSDNYQEKLDLLKYEILTSKDAAFAYFFAKDFAQSERQMSNIPIENKDYKYIFLFAKHIKDVNFDLLQDLILKSKKISYIVNFACFVSNSDVAKFEKVILDFKNPKSYYMFIRYLIPSNIEEFKNLLLHSNRPRYVYEIAKYLTNKKDLEIAQNFILNSGSFLYLKLYAQNIVSADVSLFDKVIMKRKNKQEISSFVKNVPNSKLKSIISFL